MHLDKAIMRRKYWVEEISYLSGNFTLDSKNLEDEIEKEIQSEGIACLSDHLRFCGNIPEQYSHDSSEEKLYSKYTDSVISFAFKAIGLESRVLTERGDAADVAVIANGYTFVADAKSFRLSRTAKNQKDFKVQAMDGWKQGSDKAMVVCPIHQLPTRSSQIYSQSIDRDVLIFSYPHLSALLWLSAVESQDSAQELLRKIFYLIPALDKSKEAAVYWNTINNAFLDHSDKSKDCWLAEIQISQAILNEGKNESFEHLNSVKEKILSLSHDEAIDMLLSRMNISGRYQTITQVQQSPIYSI